MGYLVTRDGSRACPSKAKAIVQMPKPTCAKEVQRFIRKCQYYRKCIPNFSHVAAPLFKASPPVATSSGPMRATSRGHAVGRP